MADTPQVISTQAAVVGCLLIDPSLCGEIFARTTAEDFVTPEYRHVYEAARGLFAHGRPVDAVTVCAALGGDEYRKLLFEIMQVTPSAAVWEEYVGLLRDQSRLYRLQLLGSRLTAAVTLDEARGVLSQAQELTADRTGIRAVNVTQGMMDFLADLDRTPEYIPTGIGQLDRRARIERGDLIVLGGRPSAGKTALGIQMADRISRDYSVGIFSLETTDRKIYARFFSQAVLIDFGDIKSGKVPAEDVQRLVERKAELMQRRLEVVPASGMTVADIQAVALARQYDVIMVDYLQLIRADGRSANRTEEVSRISMELHTLAQRHGITVFALSQLARAEKVDGRQKAPTLASLRESGQIEQDADVVLLLYLTDPGNPQSDRRLKIAKNKEGEIGAFDLDFDGRHQQFCEIMKDPPPKIPRYKRQKQEDAQQQLRLPEKKYIADAEVRPYEQTQQDSQIPSGSE